MLVFTEQIVDDNENASITEEQIRLSIQKTLERLGQALKKKLSKNVNNEVSESNQP
jgi:hypothetical protein